MMRGESRQDAGESRQDNMVRGESRQDAGERQTGCGGRQI